MKQIIYCIAAAFLVTSCTPSQVATTTNETNSMNTNQGIDRSVMPTPGPSPEVKVGKPESFTLENGLQVMVVENNKLPRVSFNLTIDNPMLGEGDKKGVKSLLGSMMGNGTSTISKDEYNEEIDFYGANVNLSSTGAYASTLSKYFPQILDLVAQGLLDPLLTQEEFDSEKNKLVESLKADEKSVTSVAGNVRDALVFGSTHPFGEFVNDKTVQNVTFADVQSYYKNNFLPNNAYLVVVGDIKFNDAKKLITEKFSNWKKGNIQANSYSAPKNLPSAQINFVDMPNAVQSEVATMSVTNLKMTDPDYFATLMANQILGGGGEGRLFLNLREAHGWTYGSYSRVAGDKDVNRFMTTASVRNAVTDSAVVEILNELGRIRTELVSDEELKNAKAKYIGNFVMQVEKPEVVARQALQTKTQNLPEDFYENYIKNINAVTKEDVRAAAQKYFGKDNARIVVVGKSDEVLPALQKMNMPIKYYDRYAAEIEAPKKQTAIPAGATPIKIVNKYLEKIGGKDKAKAVKSLKAEFTMTGAAPQPLSGVMLQMAPNKDKMEIKMGEMVVMSQSFDGTKLKVSSMGQSEEKSGEDVAKEAAKKGIVEQAFYTEDQLEMVSITPVNGKDAYKIRVKKGGTDVLEFYDTESGLLTQAISTQETPQGEIPVVSTFEDYKAVKGILFPHRLTQSMGPQNMVITIDSYVMDEGVSASDF